MSIGAMIFVVIETILLGIIFLAYQDILSKYKEIIDGDNK